MATMGFSCLLLSTSEIELPIKRHV
ncbi:humanin-like 5 [Piliocolobus tephrosceles]|uniref:MT-RNR2 like 5 (pseudo n=1 Tax=Piliocolobus tephrosceles TaxID=591936 RepID=A0A8C9J5S6_9PRIM|nr:humanin-like 5 [Chlorocebus sabaeus]XP_011906181.1 PREDICTED: humanin-like 5 [Cercocebus atys]XP_015003084.1 humanin-like 5 [Macaca mulatta]XP_023080984.1 humanin-like 5 [Piliocolobus tephrosceles]